LDYSSLSAAIQSFTENQFPSTTLADGSSVSSKTQIDTLIKQAEQRIYNAVESIVMRKSTSWTDTLGTGLFTLPAEVLYMYSVVPATGSALLAKEPSYLREAFGPSPAAGASTHYALTGVSGGALTLEVVPKQAGNAYTVFYAAYPESIVTAGTTWLGEHYDAALLYGSLLEAAVFMKGEADMVALYDTKFKEALLQFKLLSDGKQRGDIYRSGQTKVPVV
jgi:hypothetical protein